MISTILMVIFLLVMFAFALFLTIGSIKAKNNIILVFGLYGLIVVPLCLGLLLKEGL